MAAEVYYDEAVEQEGDWGWAWYCGSCDYKYTFPNEGEAIEDADYHNAEECEDA